MPFVWISVVLLLVLLVSVWISKRTYAKVIFLTLAAAVLVVGGFETYYAFNSGGGRGQFRSQIVDASGQAVETREKHDILGYALVPNQTAVMTKWHEDEVIYEMKLTIDDDGLRISPPDRGGNDIACILFFGGSFTFGAGLDDQETLPYQVGVKEGGRYRVKNFSNRGYGPHQMLATIESGILDETIDCRPRYAIYQAIIAHGQRVLGRARWDSHGPRYEIDEHGTAVRRGNFDDPPDSILGRQMRDRVFGASFLYRKLVMGRKSREGIDLLIAVVDKSRRLIESKFPGAAFHVLLSGPAGSGLSRYFKDGFRERGVAVHSWQDIFPEGTRNRPELHISEHDGHPSALANEIVADYIVRRIVKD